MLYDEQHVAQLNSLYKSKRDPEDTKKSTLYRFFFPLDANYETKRNPYSGAEPLTSVNPRDGSFPMINNDYADHKN